MGPLGFGGPWSICRGEVQACLVPKSPWWLRSRRSCPRWHAARRRHAAGFAAGKQPEPLENLPESDYTVIASGYPPVASTLRITPGQPHFHDVHLGYPEA
jgi:hypothetical protein